MFQQYEFPIAFAFHGVTDFFFFFYRGVYFVDFLHLQSFSAFFWAAAISFTSNHIFFIVHVISSRVISGLDSSTFQIISVYSTLITLNCFHEFLLHYVFLFGLQNECLSTLTGSSISISPVPFHHKSSMYYSTV